MYNKLLINKKNKTKNIRRTVCFALLFSMAVSMTGCGSSDSDNNKTAEATDEAGNASADADSLEDFYPSKTQKEFSNDYLTITLTDDYEEIETKDYVFNYSSPYSLCFGMSEAKDSVAAAGYTVSNIDDYAVVAMQAAGITAEVTSFNDTTRTFAWEKKINNVDYCYKAYVTETESSYWMFQFAAQKEVFEVLNNEYDSYYNSIVFKN